MNKQVDELILDAIVEENEALSDQQRTKMLESIAELRVMFEKNPKLTAEAELMMAIDGENPQVSLPRSPEASLTRGRLPQIIPIAAASSHTTVERKLLKEVGYQIVGKNDAERRIEITLPHAVAESADFNLFLLVVEATGVQSKMFVLFDTCRETGQSFATLHISEMPEIQKEGAVVRFESDTTTILKEMTPDDLRRLTSHPRIENDTEFAEKIRRLETEFANQGSDGND